MTPLPFFCAFPFPFALAAAQPFGTLPAQHALDFYERDASRSQEARAERGDREGRRKREKWQQEAGGCIYRVMQPVSCN